MSRLEVMVRELGSMDRHRRHLECLGHLPVQAEPTARDRPLVQRLADERVREREAIDFVGILHDEPRRHCRLQVGEEGFGPGVAGNDPEGGKPEVGPEHGRQRERFQRSGSQPVQALADDVLDALGHACGHIGRLVEAVEHLLDEERVAPRLVAQLLGQRGVDSRLPDAAADQCLGLRSVEPLEDDALDESLAP